jgi:hypothetical protein
LITFREERRRRRRRRRKKTVVMKRGCDVTSFEYVKERARSWR